VTGTIVSSEVITATTSLVTGLKTGQKSVSLSCAGNGSIISPSTTTTVLPSSSVVKTISTLLLEVAGSTT